MSPFFLRLQDFGKLSDSLTKHDLAVRQCFVSLVQRAVAAISKQPAAIQSAWPEVQTNSVQKTPLSCAFVGHLLCGDKDWAVSHFSHMAQSF